jgi:hypothetical protein
VRRFSKRCEIEPVCPAGQYSTQQNKTRTYQAPGIRFQAPESALDVQTDARQKKSQSEPWKHASSGLPDATELRNAPAARTHAGHNTADATSCNSRDLPAPLHLEG